MKSPFHRLIPAALAAVLAPLASAQGTADGYTNFIRQIQLPYEPDRITRDVYVPQNGEQLSPLAINSNGAQFELHTVKASPLTSYLLDTKYVGSYVPIASVKITSEDPYQPIPRTRADRPFQVQIQISGLLAGPNDPEASKKVELLRHVQSYGAGDGTAVNRSQASLFSQSHITTNGLTSLSYGLSSVPGGNRSKLRGEERFSIYSIPDLQAPASQLASLFIQVWPVADGKISGITDSETIGFSAPPLTLAINDIYPDSEVYAQVYPGNQSLGTKGTVLPGSVLVLKDSAPQNRVLTVAGWDHALTTDGVWTMELLTSTPFGIDRLDYVTFNVDRTITINGSITTID